MAIDRPLVARESLHPRAVPVEDRIAQAVQGKCSVGLKVALAARLGYPTQQYARGPIVLAVVTSVDRCARPEQEVEHPSNSHWVGRQHIGIARHGE